MKAGITTGVFFVLIFMGFVCPIGAAERSDRDPSAAPLADDNNLMIRFNSLVRRAQIVEKNDGKPAAIEFYREALSEPTFDDFGLIHLRLAQLLAQMNNTAAAAFHFVACHRDRRVEQVDRQVICWQGFKQNTAVLTIRDLPSDGRVSVLEPAEFIGPFDSGGRLPKGQLRLLVEAPDRRPQTSQIDLSTDRVWRAELGMNVPAGPLVPDGFIQAAEAEEPVAAPREKRGIMTPILVSALGAATVGFGVYLGLDTQTTLQDVRAREAAGRCRGDTCRAELNDLANNANLSDGLWLAGSVITSSGLAWLWYALNDSGEQD